MKCSEIGEMLSTYLDNQITDQKREQLENHIKTCSACSQELYNLRQTVRILQSMGEIAPPRNFRKQLMDKLKDEQGKKRINNIKAFGIFSVGIRKYIAAAAIIIGVGIGAGIYINNHGLDSGVGTLNVALKNNGAPEVRDTKSGAPKSEPKVKSPEDLGGNLGTEGSNPSSGSIQYQKVVPPGILAATQDKVPEQSLSKTMKQTPAPAPAPAPAPDRIPEAALSLVQEDGRDQNAGQRIIKEGNIVLEVQKYVQFKTNLTALVAKYQGYIETSNENTTEIKSASFTVRVPVAGFTDFLTSLDAEGKVQNQQIYGRDAVVEYGEIETRLQAMMTEEERLLALTGKTQSIDDALTLENELAAIRREIETVQGQLKNLENAASFSAIRLEVKEL